MKKQLFFFMFAFVAHSACGMQNPSDVSEVQIGLSYLNQNLTSMAPGVFETEVSPVWYKHMSFLNRYLKKSFNEADIYHDEVFFNSYYYSQAAYKMTYPQIKSLLCGGLAVLQKVEIPSKDQIGHKTALQREYLLVLKDLEAFNASNTAYRSLWEDGKWRQIREAIKGT